MFVHAPHFQLLTFWVADRTQQITTRWTMAMNFSLLPWNPELVFTGTLIMGAILKWGIYGKSPRKY